MGSFVMNGVCGGEYNMHLVWRNATFLVRQLHGKVDVVIRLVHSEI